MESKKISKNLVSLNAIFIFILVLTISSFFYNYSSGAENDLQIVPNSLIVDEGKQFYVTVYQGDEDGAEIEGATVYIANYGDPTTTNEDGVAFFFAPDISNSEDSIRVHAQKEGYNSKYVDIKVNAAESWWDGVLESPYFLIVVCMVILIFAILFVHFRQKRAIYSRAKEISDKKVVEKYENDDMSSKQNYNVQHYSNQVVRSKPTDDTKIEEIRISRTNNDKKFTPVQSKKDQDEQVIDRKKETKDEYEWFEGTDDIKYEIDKLTGEIDEDGIDKWYEGIDGLKDKIDEKMKKKEKKKNNEK